MKKTKKKFYTSKDTLAHLVCKATSSPLVAYVARTGPEIAKVIKEPSFVGFVSTLASSLLTLTDEFVFDDLYEWFRSHNMRRPLNSVDTELYALMFENEPYDTIFTSTRDVVIRLYNIGENHFGFRVNLSDNSEPPNSVYHDFATDDDLYAAMKPLIWRHFGESLLYVTPNEDHVTYHVERDETIKPLTSELAGQKVADFRRALEADVSRSLLLVGPPGTGKSTIARAIMMQLGLKCLRLDESTVNNSYMIRTICRIFQPDAVIIDDIDQINDLHGALEFFKSNVKVIISTTNHPEQLPPAVLRPGRIDEIELVEHLNNNVIENMLGHELIDMFDRVKDLPIAFINELVVLNKLYTRDVALQRLERLINRAKHTSTAQYMEGAVSTLIGEDDEEDVEDRITPSERVAPKYD